MRFLIDAGGLFAELIWLWALYECFQHETDPTWRWILLVGNFPAAAVYLVIRKFPAHTIPIPTPLRVWMLRREIGEARFAARHIGKAHQYANLGKVLQSAGQTQEALAAYHTALEQQPNHDESLWGIVTLKMQQGETAAARRALEALLQSAPDYQSGDAALLYIRILLKADEFDAGEKALERYLQRRSEPEARFYMARLLARRGEIVRAKELLDLVIDDVHDSPPYHAKRNHRWLKAAQKLRNEIGQNRGGAK